MVVALVVQAVAETAAPLVLGEAPSSTERLALQILAAVAEVLIQNQLLQEMADQESSLFVT